MGQCGNCKTEGWSKGELSPPCDDSICTFPYYEGSGEITADINNSDDGWVQVTLSGRSAQYLTEKEIEKALELLRTMDE